MESLVIAGDFGPGEGAALALADAAVRPVPPSYVLDSGSRAAAFEAGLAAEDAVSSPDGDLRPGAGTDAIPASAGGVVIVRRPDERGAVDLRSISGTKDG